jgi:hypothetical protein
MTEYIVTWTTGVDADTPLEAAQLVHQWMLDPESTAQCFEVQDERGNEWDVDLWPEPVATKKP